LEQQGTKHLSDLICSEFCHKSNFVRTDFYEGKDLGNDVLAYDTV
jgi:hypothetical protein